MGETTRYTFFGFQTEVDEAETRRWYAQAEPWGCCCRCCRNFLALARERRLPEFVLVSNMFDMFGKDFIGVGSDNPVFNDKSILARMDLGKI